MLAVHTRLSYSLCHRLSPIVASFRLSVPCSYYNLARFNEKFERAYVLQAQEEVRWNARQKEYLDNERALMGNVPGWVVNKRRYLTQWEDRPDREVLDMRKSGPW